METDNAIFENLRLAVQSSQRLKGHPINRDTLRLWSCLVREARSRRSREPLFDPAEFDRLIAQLDIVVAEKAT